MADTATTFAGIHNENEFYSHHYLSEIFTGDIRDTVARWRDAAEAAGGAGAGARTPYEALRALARDYLQFRSQFAHERRHEARVRRASAGGSPSSSTPSATGTSPTITSSRMATRCRCCSPGASTAPSPC